MIKSSFVPAIIASLVPFLAGCSPNKPPYPSAQNAQGYQRNPSNTVNASRPGTSPAPRNIPPSPQYSPANTNNPPTTSAGTPNRTWQESEQIWEKGYTESWMISAVYKGIYSNVIRYASGSGEKTYAICRAKMHLSAMMFAMNQNYCPKQVGDAYLQRMAGNLNGTEGMCVMFEWARWIGDASALKNPSLTRIFEAPVKDARLFHQRHGCDSKESRQFFANVQGFFEVAQGGAASLAPKPVAGGVPLHSHRLMPFNANFWAGERDAVYGQLKQLEAGNPQLFRCEYGPSNSDGTGYTARYFWQNQLPAGFSPSLRGTNPISRFPAKAVNACPATLSEAEGR